VDPEVDVERSSQLTRVPDGEGDPDRVADRRPLGRHARRLDRRVLRLVEAGQLERRAVAALDRRPECMADHPSTLRAGAGSTP
jgi:hypothetical protein